MCWVISHPERSPLWLGTWPLSAPWLGPIVLFIVPRRRRRWDPCMPRQGRRGGTKPPSTDRRPWLCQSSPRSGSAAFACPGWGCRATYIDRISMATLVRRDEEQQDNGRRRALLLLVWWVELFRSFHGRLTRGLRMSQATGGGALLAHRAGRGWGRCADQAAQRPRAAVNQNPILTSNQS